MENWLQTVREFWGYSSAWIEDFYRDHTGLVALLGLVVAGVGTLFAYRALGKSKPIRQLGPPPDQLKRNRLQMIARVRHDWIEGVRSTRIVIFRPSGF